MVPFTGLVVDAANSREWPQPLNTSERSIGVMISNARTGGIAARVCTVTGTVLSWSLMRGMALSFR